MKNSCILFIVPLPPPVHGSAMVSQQIRDSHVINDAFRCDYVNLSTSRRMDEIGKRNPIKLWRMVSAFIKTFWLLLTRRYSLCYLAITCHGGKKWERFVNAIILSQHSFYLVPKILASLTLRRNSF